MGIPVNTAKPNKGNQKQMMHNQNQGQQNSFGNQNDFGNQNGHSSMWQGNMAHGSVIGTRENIKIIQTQDFDQYGVRVEVMEYQALLGSTNIFSAQDLWFMKEANIKCRQIAIYILDSGVKIEAGAMSYYQGPLELTTGIIDVGKFLGQTITGKLTGEKIVMPEYKGSGILVLEPSFKHFIVMELKQGESIICDKGMYFAASTTVSIQPCFAGGVTGSLFGGEGIFQQMISGPGMVILESPVPMCEINKVPLYNDVLRVDGNFALLRTGNVSMNVERAGKTLVGSAMSGEGLVNCFRGTGEVWLAPTIKAYDGLRVARMNGGNVASVDFNTSTGRASSK